MLLGVASAFCLLGGIVSWIVIDNWLIRRTGEVSWEGASVLCVRLSEACWLCILGLPLLNRANVAVVACRFSDC